MLKRGLNQVNNIFFTAKVNICLFMIYYSEQGDCYEVRSSIVDTGNFAYGIRM